MQGFRRILEDSGEVWRILRDLAGFSATFQDFRDPREFVGFCRIRGDFVAGSQDLAGYGEIAGVVSKDFARRDGVLQRFRRILGGSGGFWRTLGNFGGIRRIAQDFAGVWEMFQDFRVSRDFVEV